VTDSPVLDLPLAEEPPHNLGAEQIALGAMMLDRDALDEIAAILQPRDYYRSGHGVIHETLLRLRDAGQPTGPVAVLNELQRAGELRGALDGPYLHHLIEVVPSPGMGAHHARIVAKHAATWRAQEKLSRAHDITRSPNFDPERDMDRVRALVDEATGDTLTGPGTAEWLAVEAYELLDQLERPLPPDEVTPPYADLRLVIPALRPGQLVTVAGRPGTGKTVVCGDFARHVGLQQGLPVAWFTLEMTRTEIITRIFSAEAAVSHSHLQGHTLDEAEWGRLAGAAAKFTESRILIDEKSAATLGHIQAGLRRMSRTAVPALVVVDYVQLAESPGAPSRQEEISRLTRGLKELAKDNGVPVLMAAQLNRGPEGHKDKRPVLSNLRESGELENSSDIVILLYREEVHEPDTPRIGEMDLIVAKHRNGPLATVTVAFQGRFCRAVGLSKQDAPTQEWTPSGVLGGAA
jgi:replicative DNA helicase